MTNNTLEDFGRRDLSFKVPKVVEVLPEHFGSEYPQLIALLEAYMEFMDSDGNVNDRIREISTVRDIDAVSIEFLNFLLEETGNGISADTFVDPREIAKNFPDFYRFKGSLFSAQSFFRALHGEEAEISYPKDQVFIVGESRIGPESLRFIQNGALYQTLSVLVRSSRPISEWQDLYKRYVHPAGFYLGGQVLAEGIVDLSLVEMPRAIPDPAAAEVTVGGGLDAVADITPNLGQDPLTAFIQSPDSDTQYRINLDKGIDLFDSVTFADVDNQYDTIFDHSTINTVGFSDSHESPGITFSNTIENWSQETF